VQWWDELGDTRGSGAVAVLGVAQIGPVKLPGGGGAGSLKPPGMSGDLLA